MAKQKITQNQLLINKYVDANGWTVYDYGTFKQWRKSGTVGQTWTASQWKFVGTGTFPAGQTSTNKFLEAAVGVGDSAITVMVSMSATPEIYFTTTNQYGGAVTTNIYWSACITEM